MVKNKNIFAVVSYPFLPATTGGEISTLNILGFMGKVNNVTVFTVEPYEDVSNQKFDFELIIGMPFKPWRYANILLLPKLLKLIKAHKTDYIFFDQPFLGWLIPFLRIFTGKKVFLRSNNIEYMRFKSMGKKWWPMLYMYEKLVYKSANLVIFVSDIDQQIAITEFDLKPENTLLVPYGIPHRVLPEPTLKARNFLAQAHQIPAQNKILLFFATMSYQPNYEAVGFIADNIYPLLKQQLNHFTILICGKNLPDFIQQKLTDKPEIIYCGFVQDIETYIDGADVMINPILSGGGVKTKAIDTLGRGQVVISTQTGAEGINPEVCGKNLQIADDNNWQQFTNIILTVMSEPKPTIPNTFFETYSWAGIIDSLGKKLEELK